MSRQHANLLEEAEACEHLARLTHFKPERDALLRRAALFRREAERLEGGLAHRRMAEHSFLPAITAGMEDWRDQAPQRAARFSA
jgi:hypothetical protein